MNTFRQQYIADHGIAFAGIDTWRVECATEIHSIVDKERQQLSNGREDPPPARCAKCESIFSVFRDDGAVVRQTALSWSE